MGRLTDGKNASIRHRKDDKLFVPCPEKRRASLITHSLQLTPLEQSLRMRLARTSKRINSCRSFADTGGVHGRELLFLFCARLIRWLAILLHVGVHTDQLLTRETCAGYTSIRGTCPIGVSRESARTLWIIVTRTKEETPSPLDAHQNQTMDKGPVLRLAPSSIRLQYLQK